MVSAGLSGSAGVARSARPEGKPARAPRRRSPWARTRAGSLPGSPRSAPCTSAAAPRRTRSALPRARSSSSPPPALRRTTPRNSIAQAVLAASNSSSRVRAMASLRVRVPSSRSSSGQTSARTSERAVSPAGSGSSTVDELDVTQGEAAVGHPLHRREQQPLGRELEVHGPLGQDAVLELESARFPGQHVGQDPLDLHARRVAQLALVDEAALREHLGERVAGAHLGVDLVELLARDAAALDEDRAQLIARVVRGAEEDAAPPEVESLGMHRAGDLEGSRGPVAMQIHEEMGERRRLDVPADRERFRHPPSTARVGRRTASGSQAKISRNCSTFRCIC